MKKILFVEDDAVIAKIYSQKLADAGFDVAVAADGLMAIKRLMEIKPDLVVLDLQLPKMSGLDVIKFMRSNKAVAATPTVVFSNSFINKVGEEVASLGVEEMLAKPAVTPALLIETINRILDRVAAAQNAPTPTPDPESGLNIPPPPNYAPGKRPAASPPRESDTHQNESAAGFRKRIRRDFFEQLPAISKGVQQACQDFLDTPPTPARLPKLEILSRKIGFVTHMTGMAACYRIAQLSSSLEALLFELQERPAAISDSSCQTINTTVALLADWLARADQPDEQCLSPTTILVVDDDAVSNRALVFALSRVNLIAKSVTDPFQALERLRESQYDAVLLDINLPGMSGIMVCEQMRRMPHHLRTPVIFVSGHSEFEPAARTIAGDNDDFITKPILPIELTVKVTAHVLKRRLAEQMPSR